MKSILKIMDEMYSETYYKKYYTEAHERASKDYDQKRADFLDKICDTLQNEFYCLEDSRCQVEIERETEIMQFVFDFCCNLFFEMFLKPKAFLD